MERLTADQIIQRANDLKKENNLPYRQGVVGIVRNRKGMYLVVQMRSYQDNEWRWPGGGIDEGEEPETALLRELREELDSNAFEIVKQSTHKTQYDFPDNVIVESYKKRGLLYRGQQQTQYLVSFTGTETDLHPDENELKRIAWVPREQLRECFIFEGQWELAEKTIEELLI